MDRIQLLFAILRFLFRTISVIIAMVTRSGGGREQSFGIGQRLRLSDCAMFVNCDQTFPRICAAVGSPIVTEVTIECDKCCELCC